MGLAYGWFYGAYYYCTTGSYYGDDYYWNNYQGNDTSAFNETYYPEPVMIVN